jgi:uncharacterized protein (TIGR02453 family)
MATTATTTTFSGFEPAAIQFLADLAANNDRSWFQPRKADYERLLKRPLEALCVALAERFVARRIPLVADPARSPFRVYRDVRFSRDKSPYKTHLGASFPWTTGTGEEPKVHGSGGYFHLAPGEIYVGAGMWHPEKDRLDAWRRAAADDTASIRSMLDEPRFVATFGTVTTDGDHALKRVPAGYPADHPAAELLRLKDVVFGRRLSDREATSASLPDTIAETLEPGVPLLRFLAGL